MQCIEWHRMKGNYYSFVIEMEKLIGFNALLDFTYHYQIYISSMNIAHANWLIIIKRMIL